MEPHVQNSKHWSLAYRTVLCLQGTSVLHGESGQGILLKLTIFLLLLFSCSVVSASATPWTTALQALLSTGFPRQEPWNGLSFPSPGNLPDPVSKPMSPSLAGSFFTTEPPEKRSCAASSLRLCGHKGQIVKTLESLSELGSVIQGLYCVILARDWVFTT